jgi:hypothetical protein
VECELRPWWKQIYNLSLSALMLSLRYSSLLAGGVCGIREQTRHNFFQVTVKQSLRCPTRTNILIWPRYSQVAIKNLPKCIFPPKNYLDIMNFGHQLKEFATYYITVVNVAVTSVPERPIPSFENKASSTP